jgi:hypothetical protein
MGVDPGNDGGMSLIDANGRTIHFNRIVDINGIINFFVFVAHLRGTDDIVCCYEEYRGTQAAVSARSGGRYVGIFETLCCIHDIRMVKTPPQTWKAHHKLIVHQPKGAPKLGEAERYAMSKRKSMEMVAACFPSVNLVFPRCKVKHEGVAESLLIAEYARQINL